MVAALAPAPGTPPARGRHEIAAEMTWDTLAKSRRSACVDRTSGSRFAANQLRLLLFMAAYPCSKGGRLPRGPRPSAPRRSDSSASAC